MTAPSESRLKILGLLAIDPNSITPHYQQLEDHLVGAVARGEVQPGDPLPSEREFSKSLGISRMTVRRALTNLEARGKLQSRVGKGWFVSPAKTEQKLELLGGFSADMRATDHEVHSKLLGFKRAPADQDLAQKLGIGEGDTVYFLDRVRMIDGDPVGLEYSRIPVELCPGLEQFDFTHDSLYRVLKEELGIRLDRAYQSIEASLITWQEARLLNVEPGVPAIRGQRTVFNPEGIIVEVSTAVYRGDRYRYQLELEGESTCRGTLV